MSTSGKQESSTGHFQASLGDAGHCLSILNSVVFAACFVYFSSNEIDPLFDEDWKRLGFCVTNPGVPLWTSHDLCLYVDFASAAILAALYWPQRKTPGMEHANLIMSTGILGVAGHGMGHGLIGYAMRKKLGVEDSNGEEEIVQGPGVFSYFIFLMFWIALLKTSIPNASFTFTVLLSVVVGAVQAQLPEQFGFTYVQTVLMIFFSCNQLIRPREEKDFHYTLYVWLVGVPITFVAWMESTQCSAFVKDRLYGHLVYDAFIPLGMLLWYSLCSGRVSATNTHVKVKNI
jgi:hypothetical protein